jgi:YgiT-type zinc finger domain-containing protein
MKREMQELRVLRCPTCGSDRLERVCRDVTRVFDGMEYTVRQLDFHECPVCGEKVYGPEAARRIQAESPAFVKHFT